MTEAINLDIWQTNSPPVTYLNGLLLFVGGLAIVRAHNRWLPAWPIVITLVGWSAIAFGLFRMFAPEAQQGGENLPTYALIGAILAVGVFLTIKAYAPNRNLRDRLRRWLQRRGRHDLPRQRPPLLGLRWRRL